MASKDEPSQSCSLTISITFNSTNYGQTAVPMDKLRFHVYATKFTHMVMLSQNPFWPGSLCGSLVMLKKDFAYLSCLSIC